MPINTASIYALLEPGLWKVDGEYEKLPKLWPKVFKTREAKLATERMARNRFTELARIKTEGAATHFDNAPGFRYYFNATTFEVGLGYAITQKAIDDNLYMSDFNQSNLGLQNSFAQFKEIQAWSLFNNGTTYDQTIGGDGKALFDPAHPYDYGTWGNTFTIQQDLNETSLLQSSLNIQNTFVDEAGLKIFAEPRKLIIPINLIPIAERLLKSELRPGTANNDVNIIPKMPGGISEYIAVRYLTSNYAWYLTTNIDGLVMFERKKFKTKMWTDDGTDNLLVSGYERYVPQYYDPRCAYASTPTS